MSDNVTGVNEGDSVTGINESSPVNEIIAAVKSELAELSDVEAVEAILFSFVDAGVKMGLGAQMILQQAAEALVNDLGFHR